VDNATLAFNVVSLPAHGTVVITNAATGAYTYSPAANFSGADSFTFSATDGALVSNVATMTVTVTAVNDGPVARTTVVTTSEGASAGGVLQATDPEGDGLTFSVVTAPSKGVVTITDATTGAFTYTPNAGAVGCDTFTFEASNGGDSSTGTGLVFIVAGSPRWPGQAVRASVASGGAQGNSISAWSALSADGRYVAFHSSASNLVAGDTNDRDDVFVHDRATGETTRVSVASGGTQANDTSLRPALSADGRYVAFHSSASNLVAGDTNGGFDLFVHDRQTGQTTRVSVGTGGTQSNGDSLRPVLSADGRHVAFHSLASNLVAGDTNLTWDVFVHDRQTGQTVRVSVTSDGTQGDNFSSDPALSADGRYVAFSSSASNLVAGDTNAVSDAFVHDRQTAQTMRVSVASGGAQGNGEGAWPVLSADGRYVAFMSMSSNLVAGDTNGANDAFVHDRQTGQTTRVSVASGGGQGNGFSDVPRLSADGRYVVFRSAASNLVTGDTNNALDVFVHDRVTLETTRVSVASDGTQSNSPGNAGNFPVFSADGRYVAFWSPASNLVPGDTNGSDDVFVVGGVSVSPAAVNVGASGGTASVNVSFDYPGTPWTATTTASWITIASGASGNGTVGLTVAPNPGAARTATVLVALHPVTVTQEASPGQPATMISPTPGSGLTSTTTTFTWSPGTGVSQYWLSVGTTPGGGQVYYASTGTNRSVTVSGLPNLGGLVYVRLWSRIGTAWSFIDYTYTSVDHRARLILPAPGGTLPGSSALFRWTPGSGVTDRWLYVGTTPGAANIYNAQQLSATERLITGLPTTGITLYTRLWSFLNGSWTFIDYSFRAATGTVATMTSPANGATFGGSSATLTWTIPAGVTQVWLYVGTSVGGATIVNVNKGMGTSHTVTGLPTNGSNIYARLWSLQGGSWKWIDYHFYALGGAKATLILPAAGGTLAGPTATFRWTAGTGVTDKWLYIGTTAGAANVYNAQQFALTERTITGLPTTGVPLYARLWSLMNGAWVFTDYSFRAADPMLASLTSPANGVKLSGSSATFTWAKPAATTQTWIYIGTAVGQANVLTVNTGPRCRTRRPGYRPTAAIFMCGSGRSRAVRGSGSIITSSRRARRSGNRARSSRLRQRSRSDKAFRGAVRKDRAAPAHGQIPLPRTATTTVLDRQPAEIDGTQAKEHTSFPSSSAASGPKRACVESVGRGL
jgi:hypothetical protein